MMQLLAIPDKTPMATVDITFHCSVTNAVFASESQARGQLNEFNRACVACLLQKTPR